MAEFVYITDDTYSKKQVLRMEHLVLKVLSFDLAAPTIVQFLTQYFLKQRVCNKVESLSMVSEAVQGAVEVLVTIELSVQNSGFTTCLFIFPSVSRRVKFS